MLKKLLSLTLIIPVLITVLSFGLIPNSANAAYTTNCSNNYYQCSKAFIEHGDKIAYSDWIFAYYGDTIFYDVSTYSDSLFQVGAWVEDASGKKVSTKDLIATGGGSGGQNGHNFQAPESGYYRLVLQSGDSSQGRSHGYGHIYRYY